MAGEYKNNSESNKWYVAHNNNDVVHFGELASLAGVKTGQPHLDIFDTEALMAAKVDDLKSEDGWYDKNKRS